MGQKLSILAGVVTLALPSLALAGPTEFSVPGNDLVPATGPGAGSGGYDTRVAANGVVPNDSATMSLIMIDALDHSISINTGGSPAVVRSGNFTDIGANRNGGGHILASWDAIVSGNSTYVNAIFKTTDGSQFMPPTATVNGQPAFFWSWNFGTTDGVDFLSWVTNVTVQSARIYMSANSGQSFSSSSNIAAGLATNWMPGRDGGQYLASIGDGTNYIMLQYQLNIVPAPTGLAAFAGSTLLIARRRRR